MVNMVNYFMKDTIFIAGINKINLMKIKSDVISSKSKKFVKTPLHK